jgi:carbamoyltransferase
MSKKYYIGLTSTFHDPAIAIVDDMGEVLFAEATERYLQTKRAMGCPADPIMWSQKLIKKYCDPNAEFHVATSWSNQYVKSLNRLNFFGFLKQDPTNRLNKILFNKIIKTQLPDHNLVWMTKKMLASNIQTSATFERNLRVYFGVEKIKNYQFEHHLCHAASGVFASGFNEALCLIVDGMGEKGSVSYYTFENNTIKKQGAHIGFESLGFFYAFLTYLCDFDPIKGEEWKVMGLSSYGKINQSYYDLLDSILFVDGAKIKFKSSSEKMKTIFSYIHNDINASPLTSFEKRASLAHTGQLLFTKYVTNLIRSLEGISKTKNLVLAGGCALNSSFNGKIIGNTKFEKLYVPSAPGDDGTSLGAAYLAYKKDNPKAILSNNLLTPYLGSTINDEDILNFITYSGYQKIKHYPDHVHIETAKMLAQGKLIGWAQGRAEFGPRSLGNRAILADPRSENMKEKINASVKFREEFRPFAPSILDEFGSEYFENYQESPYMERTLLFKKEVYHRVPAVVHIDKTGRLQTVKEEWNQKYHQLLTSFYEITGVPILLNTSFNVMGKPIIHSFNDALNVFFGSGLDALVINDYIIYK